MKIGIQSWGSNGDIRPFIALAGGLSAAGHEVTLAYVSEENLGFQTLAERLSAAGHEVTLAYVSEENLGFQTLAERLNFKLIKAFEHQLELDPMLVEKIIKKSVPGQVKMLLRTLFFPFIDEMLAAAIKLCEENDVVIWHFLVHHLPAAAEASNTPHISVALNHGGIPSHFKPPMGVPDLGDWANPIWWRLMDIALKNIFLTHFNEIRSRVKVKPLKTFKTGAMDSELLNLVAVSPAISKRPADWSDNHQICGFFNIPEDVQDHWIMPEDLKAFIEAEAPIFMTFGSLMPQDKEREAKTIQILAEAVKQSKCRAIIQYSRQDNPSELPQSPDIYYLSRAPHIQLFPHCALVVHHGGSGTTQSATFAGCPSVIVAHITDQFVFAQELYQLGIGSKPLKRKNLSVTKLARAIRQVLDTPSMKIKAEALGQQMQDEDGVSRAVELIEKLFLDENNQVGNNFIFNNSKRHF